MSLPAGCCLTLRAVPQGRREPGADAGHRDQLDMTHPGLRAARHPGTLAGALKARSQLCAITSAMTITLSLGALQSSASVELPRGERNLGKGW